MEDFHLIEKLQQVSPYWLAVLHVGGFYNCIQVQAAILSMHKCT